MIACPNLRRMAHIVCVYQTFQRGSPFLFDAMFGVIYEIQRFFLLLFDVRRVIAAGFWYYFDIKGMDLCVWMYLYHSYIYI